LRDPLGKPDHRDGVGIHVPGVEQDEIACPARGIEHEQREIAIVLAAAARGMNTASPTIRFPKSWREASPVSASILSRVLNTAEGGFAVETSR
jgi:hypothetical protein